MPRTPRSQPYRLNWPFNADQLEKVDQMLQELYDDLRNDTIQVTVDQLTGTLPVTSGGTGTATAFTAGSVVFAGTSGIYAQDQSNFFWDDTNNRLGIGTNVPTFHLQVEGSSAGGDIHASFTGYAGLGFGISLRGANGTQTAPTASASADTLGTYGFRGYGASAFSSGSRAWIEGYAAETWTNTAQGTHIAFGTCPIGSTSSAERVRIASTGFVGIGTGASVTPDTLLHVSISDANTTLTDYLKVAGRGSATRSASLVFSGRRDDAAVSGIYFQAQVKDTAGTARNLILQPSGGNVGIGTTNPLGRLHIVQGMSGATAISGLDQIILENDTTGGMSILTPDANLGEIVFGTPSDAFGGVIRWDYTAALFSIGPANAAADLVLWAGNASEKVRIKSDGNVGIGTSTFGASMAGGLAVKNGTAPTGNVTDVFQFYSADQTAGNAAPHFRTENGSVVKLYKTGTYTPTNVTPDRSFDANSTTIDELADVLGSLIADLQLTGLLG